MASDPTREAVEAARRIKRISTPYTAPELYADHVQQAIDAATARLAAKRDGARAALAEHLAQSHAKCNICGRLAALAPPAGGG